jgi:hypothetical protein
MWQIIQMNPVFRIRKVSKQGLLLSYIVLLAGCMGAKEAFLQTPVSRAALAAFYFKASIETREQALIAAYAGLMSTQIQFTSPPQALEVTRLPFGEALKQVGRADEAATSGAQALKPAWLALFEGDYQIKSPVIERLPGTAGHGCAYVILFADGSGNQAGMIDCLMAK